MTIYTHTRQVQREVEYLFSAEDSKAYPQLNRLLQQGYSFMVLKCCSDLRRPQEYSYKLACEIMCSNGTELLQRREPLTPGFRELRKLEHFTKHNMMSIMHKHFFGRELVEVG